MGDGRIGDDDQELFPARGKERADCRIGLVRRVVAASRVYTLFQSTCKLFLIYSRWFFSSLKWLRKISLRSGGIDFETTSA